MRMSVLTFVSGNRPQTVERIEFRYKTWKNRHKQLKPAQTIKPLTSLPYNLPFLSNAGHGLIFDFLCLEGVLVTRVINVCCVKF